MRWIERDMPGHSAWTILKMLIDTPADCESPATDGAIDGTGDLRDCGVLTGRSVGAIPSVVFCQITEVSHPVDSADTNRSLRYIMTSPLFPRLL